MAAQCAEYRDAINRWTHGKHLSRDTHDLDKLFEQCPRTSEQVVLYRGIARPYDPNYKTRHLATSLDREVAEQFATSELLVITLEPGSRVLPIMECSNYFEEEVIISREHTLTIVSKDGSMVNLNASSYSSGTNDHK